MMKKTMTHRLSRIFGKPVCKFLFPILVKGYENFPETGKVIICSNHLSMKDPIYISYKPKRMIRYMAKKELFENKFAAAIIRGMGAFPVDRGAGDNASMDFANQILQEEEALAIFIEGTRSKDGKLGRPRSGAAVLAFQNKAPILPVCITTKHGKPAGKFQKAIVHYGEVIPYEDLGMKEGSGAEFRNASRIIMDRIAAMREEDQPIADAF